MKTGFYSGDPTLMIQKDIPALRPTFFPSVPRMYNRIYAKIQEGIRNQTGCKRWLIDHAVATKLHYLK
jgi:long-chain acyl-CoA synthetase